MAGVMPLGCWVQSLDPAVIWYMDTLTTNYPVHCHQLHHARTHPHITTYLCSHIHPHTHTLDTHTQTAYPSVPALFQIRPNLWTVLESSNRSPSYLATSALSSRRLIFHLRSDSVKASPWQTIGCDCMKFLT